MEDKINKNDYIKNFLDGTYTCEEAQKVLDLIKKDPANKNLEHTMSEVWEETAFLSPSYSLNDKLQYERQALDIVSALDKKNETKKIYPWRKISLGVASIAAIVIIILGVYKYNWFSNPDMTYLSVSSTYGERKTVELPDGTIVYLNSCATITYPEEFNDDMRKVELNGQAYFEVKRNEKQPFVVKTYAFDVKVLGTEFDVKAYKEDEIISVNVESGKVQVDMPDAMVRLVAKEQVEINTRTQDHYKYKGDTDVAVWRTGSLRFNKTPVRDVAKELERTYDYRITFKNGQDFSNLITGAHSNKDMIAVLKSLEFTSGIHYNIDENTRQVFLYK